MVHLVAFPLLGGAIIRHSPLSEPPLHAGHMTITKGQIVVSEGHDMHTASVTLVTCSRHPAVLPRGHPADDSLVASHDARSVGVVDALTHDAVHIWWSPATSGGPSTSLASKAYKDFLTNITKVPK